MIRFYSACLALILGFGSFCAHPGVVPFAKESDGRDFLKDHRGTRILRFGDITQAIVAELDR